MANLFKLTGRGGRKSRCWYGKVKVGRQWERVKLFSDKAASNRRLVDLQRAADRRESGHTSPDAARLSLPIADLAKQYVESLKVQKKDPDHVRISTWMLDRLIELGGWKYFRDVTRESMEKVLGALDAQGMTASYQNKFVVRAKAFVNATLPDDWPDPLKRLGRVNEKGAKKNRERRAASAAELGALFALDLPPERTLAYALAAFNGLRRNEARRLLWDHLSLTATVPFLDVRKKQGSDDTLDYVPLHPYVLRLLGGRMAGMPAARVLPSVPDMKTIKRDLERAAVPLADTRGRRLDYHGLRHTFQTNLDQTGCSRATKKKLMRHAASDVTDGYAHAELAEMLAALKRLPSPQENPQVQQAAKTGTDDNPTEAPAGADHRLDQKSCCSVPVSAEPCTVGTVGDGTPAATLNVDFSRKSRDLHAGAGCCLIGGESNANLPKTRPSTQAD